MGVTPVTAPIASLVSVAVDCLGRRTRRVFRGWPNYLLLRITRDRFATRTVSFA